MRIGIQVVDIAAQLVLHIDIQCVTRTVAGYLCRCHGEHFGVFDVCRQGIHLVDDGIHILPFVGTLVPVAEFQDDVGGSRRFARNHTIAGDTTFLFHFRNGGEAFFYLTQNLVGGGQRTSRRRIDIDHHRTEVFLRHKRGLGGTHQHHHQPDTEHGNHKASPRVANQHACAFLIPLGEPFHAAVEFLGKAERPAFPTTQVIDVGLFGAEQQRTECRAGSQRVEG